MEQKTLIRRLQYDLFWVGLRPDGIVVVRVNAEAEIDVEHIRRIVDAIKLVGAGNKHPILILAGANALPTADARNYLATAESDPYSIAEAFVIESFTQKLVGNVYLRLNKPARPTRIFTSEDKAVEWLQTYL